MGADDRHSWHSAKAVRGRRQPGWSVAFVSMSTNYLGGAVPADYEPEDASTIRIPLGVDPKDDPSVRALVAHGWTVGDQWRDALDHRFKMVYLYPPRPAA